MTLRLGTLEVSLHVRSVPEGRRVAELAARVDRVAKKLADDCGWEDELVNELVDIAATAGHYCPPE